MSKTDAKAKASPKTKPGKKINGKTAPKPKAPKQGANPNKEGKKAGGAKTNAPAPKK